MEKMQPSEEDIAWFKSTFHPVPKAALPEDCIDYHVQLVSSDYDSSNDSELRLQLREVQKYANELQKQWLRGYIWQRQGFSLELIKEDGLSSLTGRTEYGDSVEDEWVIVWLLRELTKRFHNIWVKVTDTDGEFLLIEASGTIPAWLEPDIAENRVWINEGQLKIIKPASNTRSSKHTSEKLSLQEARQVVLNEPKRIMHSVSIEEEAFYRLRDYPRQIADNMHHALVKLPRKVAFLLLQKPAYIAPAIEAFYLRDPIALKPLRRKEGEVDLQFPPTDLVTLSVKFPRVGYAQIRSQDFPAPPVWKEILSSQLDSLEHARVDAGMKVTSGFEMLLSDRQHQDKQTVREMKMVLEDLKSGDESLPSDGDISRLDQRADDEKWLDISLDDLERELGGKRGEGVDGPQSGFGNKATQENLQRIVKQFEDFLNEDNGDSDTEDVFGGNTGSEDGDENGDESDAGEDKDASFDEDEFTKMMQEMMGLPLDVMKEIMSGDLDALGEDRRGDVPLEVRARTLAKVQEVDSSDDDDVNDLHQMERELQASGALDLDSIPNPTTAIREVRGKATVADPTAAYQKDAEESDEDDQGVNDFDVDFARNILRSFQSSGAKGGPAASLMSMVDGSAGGESSKRRGQK